MKLYFLYEEKTLTHKICRGCAAGVDDIFGDCDADSDDCESVVPEPEQRFI